MKFTSLQCVCISSLLLAHALAAEQPICIGSGSDEAPAESKCRGSQEADTVSLLQSRGIQVEYKDVPLAHDKSKSGIAANDVPLAYDKSKSDVAAEVMLPTLMTQHTYEQHLAFSGSGLWLVFLSLFLVLAICMLLFALVSWSKMRKDQQLETRVNSVLVPQKVTEDLAQSPPDSSLSAAGRISPFVNNRSPFVNNRSPVFTQTRLGSDGSLQSAASLQSSDRAAAQDMPPLLSASNIALASEARLLVAKAVLPRVAKGGDLFLLAPNGSPIMRANVRNVDGEFWLEVSMQVAGSSPCAMVRLVKSSIGPKNPFFGTPAGPEIFGPDGSLYGTFEMSHVGAQLISSTTALSLLKIEGNMESLQLTVKTNSGLELAKVSCHGGVESFDICINRGTDLGLIVASVLTVLLSSQL